MDVPRPWRLAWWFLVLPLIGCDAMFGLKAVTHDAHVADAPDVRDVADATMMTAASCREIQLATPGAPSGMYMIHPDGSPTLTVHCDMTTDGGGWTIVFVAPSANVMTPPVPYSTIIPGLLATAQQTLLAFRDANLGALPGAASLAMPAEWRTDTPFDYPASDIATMVSIDGAAAVPGTLRYGNEIFNVTCDGAWDSSQPFGRVCIDGTSAPFYSAFVDSGDDYCSDSTSQYDATACAADLQFTIAIR